MCDDARHARDSIIRDIPYCHYTYSISSFFVSIFSLDLFFSYFLTLRSFFALRAPPFWVGCYSCMHKTKSVFVFVGGDFTTYSNTTELTSFPCKLRTVSNDRKSLHRCIRARTKTVFSDARMKSIHKNGMQTFGAVNV